MPGGNFSGLKNWQGLFIVLSLFFTAIYYFFLFIPQRSAISERYEIGRQKREQVEAIETFVRQHPNPEQYLAGLDGQKEVVFAMIPATSQLNDFLSHLETLAATAAVKLISVKPGPPGAKDSWYVLPVEVTIQGNFWQTTAFLKYLADGPRFSSVAAINIQEQQAKLNSKIRVLIFYQP